MLNANQEDGDADYVAAQLATFSTKLSECRARGRVATKNGSLALERLIRLAETRSSGQIEVVARFLGAAWNGKRHFDLYDLRILDTEIADDMLSVIDAIRWGRVGIGDMVPNADQRIAAVLAAWGMFGEGQRGQFIAV